MNVKKPPGNHYWVLENNGQLGVIIWTCECGIRTTYTLNSQKWMWVNSSKVMYFNGLPKSCAEHKMIEALE